MMEDVFNELTVVKRSGQRVSFNGSKIAIAIKNAFDQVITNDSAKHVNKIYLQVLEYIKNNYDDRKTINVEDIQDIIEKKLQENKFEEVYILFKEYRERRAISRKAFNLKQQHKFTKAIERIVNDSKENKYLNSYPDDILLNFGKTISCEYAKTYILDNKLVRAHEEGSIYIHNLDYFWLGKISSTNVLIDNNMLNNFPNNLISSLISIKNEIDGEVGINKFDSLLIPVMIKEFKKKLKEKLESYLNVVGLINYINIKRINEIIERINTVDVDINIFDSIILNDEAKNIFSKALKDSRKYIVEYFKEKIKEMLVILNKNNEENKKYSISIGTGCSKEELLINEIYLNIIENLPYLENITTVFKLKKDSNQMLIQKIGTLILNKKNIVLSFCNSTYNKDLELVEYFGDGKRIFENYPTECKSSVGRMIVSSISINMARLGIICEGKKIDEFYKMYADVINLAKNGLLNIFEIIGDKTKKNYRELFKNNIIDDNKLESDQKIRKIIKKGTLNLELAGLKECAICLEKDEKKQKKLIKDIIAFGNKKCLEYSLDTKLNFMISETSKFRPLKKLIELDKSIYGVKKGITDKKCYERIDSLFKYKKDIEEDLQYIGEYQKELLGGNLVKVKLNKTMKLKNIIEIIELCKNKNIGFIKIIIGDEVL